MAGSDLEALSDDRMSRVVGRPSRMSGSGREARQDVQEWSGGPPGCPEMVGKPSRMSGSGWEALPDVREWSRGLPGYPGGPPNVRE